jgi:filamentous hemagglutinin family protein
LRHLLGSTAYGLLALALGGASSLLARNVLPQGGSVAADGAAIETPANNSQTITQTSPIAIINWNSFSIDQPNTVTYNQPSLTLAILNRVTGNTPSSIAGSLRANGQVYLDNPNGIAIAAGGPVYVGGGFVASMPGIGDNDFMVGKTTFTGTGRSAAVIRRSASRCG